MASIEERITKLEQRTNGINGSGHKPDNKDELIDEYTLDLEQRIEILETILMSTLDLLEREVIGRPINGSKALKESIGFERFRSAASCAALDGRPAISRPPKTVKRTTS